MRTGSAQAATKTWKIHALWIRNTLLEKDGYEEPYPTEHPTLPEGTWLTKPRGSAWSTEELGSLNTYISSRSLPAGDAFAQEAAILKTAATLVEIPRPLQEEERKEMEFYSGIAGEEVYLCAKLLKKLDKLDAHVSISNRSCYERTGSKGGKYNYLYEAFFQEWFLAPSWGETWSLPTGVTITCSPGEPRWRSEIPGTAKPDPGIFGSNTPKGWWAPVKLGCSENRIGFLLFTWAYSTLLEHGMIDIRGKATGVPARARFTSVGEPGGKVRVPTVTEAAWITYLQPYAHLMRGVLEADPTLSAGLGAAAQAFEYVKRFEGQGSITFEGILLGDLEDATNYIQFETGLVHMEAFIKPFGDVTDYIRYAPTLVLQPLQIEVDGEVIITTQGAPMGIPGTKIILHSLGKAIECRADGRRYASPPAELKLSRYANAGDDILKPGALSVLRRHKESALFYRVKPSEDKWGIYKVGGPFCEVMVHNGGVFTALANTTDNPFIVDAPRARLFSPETKPFSGDDDTNPTFGKASALAKELSWSNRDVYMYTWIFLQNFRDYGSLRGIVGIPSHFGGLGLPLPPELSFEWSHPLVKHYAFNAWCHKGTPRGASLARCLRGLSSPSLFYRGEVLDTNVEHPLSGMLPAFSLQEIEEAEGIYDPKGNKRLWDRIREIERRGYINLTNLYNRGYLFPFWERGKRTLKGWKTAPIDYRVEQLSKKLGPPQGEPPTEEEWSEVLKTPVHAYLAPLEFSKIDYLTYLDSDSGEVDSINLHQESNGLSMFLGVPNRSILWTGSK